MTGVHQGWKHPYALPRNVLDLYVVQWRREGFVKIGITKNQRWRKFAARGGRPLAVLRMPRPDAILLEVEAHAYFTECLDRAFEAAKDAEPYLRPSGGGYTECYQDDGLVVMPVLLEIASRCYPGYSRVEV